MAVPFGGRMGMRSPFGASASHAAHRPTRAMSDLVAASYQPMQAAGHIAGRHGYMLDTELSRPDTKVFVDRSGAPTIAHRGSVGVSDWIDNGLLAVGLGHLGRRHREAKRLTRQVEAKYKRPANAVGHSLGGRLAETSGAGGRVVTYNKAAGLGDLFKRTGPNQVDYRTATDLPSLLSVGQRGARVTVPHRPSLRSVPEHLLRAHRLEHLASYATRPT